MSFHHLAVTALTLSLTVEMLLGWFGAAVWHHRAWTGVGRAHTWHASPFHRCGLGPLPHRRGGRG